MRTIPDYKNLKVLTIQQNKGGVAKTTLAKLICEYLVRRGKRVLGIDLDPQCNFSTMFIQMVDDIKPPVHPEFDPDDEFWLEFDSPPPGYWSIAELFMLGHVEPYPTRYPNLDIVPSHKKDLTNFIEEIDKNRIDEEVVSHLRELLCNDFFQDNYDIIVIDTPPQTSAITNSSIRAATHLLIPTELQPNSMSGMIDISVLVSEENVKRISNKLDLVGVLPTKFDKESAAQRKILEEIKSLEFLQDKVITPPMRYLQTYANTAVPSEDSFSLFDMNDNTIAKREAMMFCGEIFDRVFDDE